MTQDFDAMYAKLETFFTQNEAAPALAELERIRSQHEDLSFRVALVGNFSQGKTYILNKLLETEIFPTAVTPETALIYEIGYGEKNEAFCIKNGECKHIPFEQGAFSSLSASSNEFAEGDCVKVSFSHPLLQNGLILYDTPGIDDILESRAALALNLLNQCDAAIVVISAIAPLSMLEQKFIETYLAAKAIPRVAILVNFYDKIDPKDRERQLRYIANKVHHAYPQAQLWLYADNVSADDYTACGLASIRTQLEKWHEDFAKDPGRNERDMLRLKNLLTCYLENMEKESAILDEDLSDSKKIISEALSQINENGSRWRTLVRDFLDKGNETAIVLTDEVEKVTADLKRMVSEDDISFLKDEMPKRLTEIRDSISTKIWEHLKADIEDLYEKIQKEFGISGSFSENNLPIAQFSVDIPVFTVKETALTPVIKAFELHAVTVINTILSYFIKDKIVLSTIASPIASAISDFCLGLETPRDEISSVLEKFTSTINAAVGRYVRELYKENAEQVKQYEDQCLQDAYSKIAAINTYEDLEKQKNTLVQILESGKKLLEEFSE